MLKNIQKYLLLNYPLLWNTKIVPLSILLILLNLIFFAIGFKNGEIDFTETNNNYNFNESEPILIFIGVLISAIIIIIWLVYYFKNNAFKSFYPKENFGLFKEWLIIFSVAFLTAMFSISYYYAKEVRVRNYFSKEEAIKRCETLSLGSIFLEGSFDVRYYDVINERGDTIQATYNYAEFMGKQYKNNSLMNKNVESFQFFDQDDDSLRKIKVKNWLFRNDKIAIKNLLKDYLKIANDHNLKANVNEKQWFDLVYNSPEFVEVNIVGKNHSLNSYNNNYAVEEPLESVDVSTSVDSTGKVVDNFDYLNKYKVKRKDYYDEYFKHYVPAANLNYAYAHIANCWVAPDIRADVILIPIYFAFGFSLLVFAFRVTSGRNWLIAGISLGVIAIVFGIISAVFRTEIIFLILANLLFISIFIHFIYVTYKKREKGISGITLNAILWMFAGFIPLNYYLFITYLKWNYNDTLNKYFADRNLKEIEISNFIFLLEENISFLIMIGVNLIFMILFMLFITTKIKKWKGIPEN
jgi:hypothetical protein